jgi:hypothetical protein
MNAHAPRRPQVHQQVHQQVLSPKLDADPSPWLGALLQGATREQLRLESRILKLRRSLRWLELVGLLLSVASATTLFTALGKAFSLSNITAMLAAGFLNFATILIVGLKKFIEDNGKLSKYEGLHDQFGEFTLKIAEPAPNDQATRKKLREAADQYRKLRHTIIRTAPEISSDTPWDNMSDEEREQYLQTRIAQ